MSTMSSGVSARPFWPRAVAGVASCIVCICLLCLAQLRAAMAGEAF